MQYLSTGKSCIHNYHICRACLGMQHILSADIHLEIFNINDELKNIERLMHYKIQEAWQFKIILNTIGVKSNYCRCHNF